MRSLRATLLLAMAASPLAAQAPAPTGSTWKFSNLIGAYCINFLVSPEDAPSLLPGDASPERLDALKNVHPALARVMADQPEYASWMPGAFCFYRFGRVELEGKELIAADGAAEVLGILAYARPRDPGPAGRRPGSAAVVHYRRANAEGGQRFQGRPAEALGHLRQGAARHRRPAHPFLGQFQGDLGWPRAVGLGRRHGTPQPGLGGQGIGQQADRAALADDRRVAPDHWSAPWWWKGRTSWPRPSANLPSVSWVPLYNVGVAELELP